MSFTVAGLRAKKAILAAIACGAASCRAVAPSPAPAPCGFSSFAKSSISWQSGLGDTTLKGRVMRVDGLRPVRFGMVLVDPGGHRLPLDSTGVFRFALPAGRYLVRVRAPNYPEAADSVTLGRDGLVILAALGQYAGDIVVTCPSRASFRKPSNDR